MADKAVDTHNAMDLLGRGLAFLEAGILTEAADCFCRAAELDNTEAQYRIAKMRLEGIGVSMNYDHAAFWFCKAAMKGHAESQMELAFMYIYGQGVPQDYGKAREWFTRSAEQGNPSAQNTLGFMYENGLGGWQDYGKAVRCYALAALQGNDDAGTALENLAYMGNGLAEQVLERLSGTKDFSDLFPVIPFKE